MIRGTKLYQGAPAEFTYINQCAVLGFFHAINSGNGEARKAWNVIYNSFVWSNLTLPTQNWSRSRSVQHPSRVQRVPNDPWWRNRWCCRDMLWPTISGWEVVRRHCEISGKARRSCLRWLELACRWQCYSPAQTDVVETQKGLIGNLILLPQASPLWIFVRKVLPLAEDVPCDTLADLRIQPWKGLGMMAEYLIRWFQHTFWNIHPPKPDPQQAIKGFLA